MPHCKSTIGRLGTRKTCGQVLRALLLGTVLLLTLVSCQSGTQEAGSTPAQTVVLAAGHELGNANPHDYGSNMALLDLLYEPLVRYGPDGTIQPALATAWTIAPDGRTLTFQLRPQVTFHDGTPCDAAAIKWNFERWVGVQAHSWLPSSTRILKVDTPDARTVVLTLREPYYPTMQDLTLIRPVRFLSPQAVNEHGAFRQPIGTGPWKIASLAAQRAVLVRHEGYWGDKPLLQQVVIDVILDAQTRIAALQSGEVQVIGGEYLGTIPPESLGILQSTPGLTVLTGSSVMSLHLMARSAKPPLDDLRVRQALNHAIDRPGMVQAIFGGRAEAATGVMASALPYVTRTGTDLYTYQPEKTHQLLAEAGWRPGPDGVLVKDGRALQLELGVDKSRLPETASLAEAMQAQVRQVGIDLTIRLHDYSGWLNAYHHGDYHLLMGFTWGPPYDPHTFLYGSFHSAGAVNYVPAYTDATLDGLIDTVLASTEVQTRQALYDHIWHYMDNHAVVIPLVSPQRLYAHRQAVTGLRLGGTEYDLAYALQQVVIRSAF